MFQIPTNLKRFLFFALVVIFSLQHNNAHASHAAGGEIVYQWLSDSTYRVTFKFYRDCSGIPAPTTVDLCYVNTCTNQAWTRTLSAVSVLPDGSSNGSPVSLGCPGVGTTCTNVTSAVPGYREWWYSANVTLPSRCSLWRFSVNISARNASVNLASGSTSAGDFYSEATLNNVVAQGNSSPFFSVKPVPSICINQPYTYNNGGVDPNSDSLSFELVMPLTGNGSCTSSPTPVSFAFATPSYNLISNPFQTNNTFSFSASTGQMTFTPALTGSNTLTVKVKEYRNGVFIGSVMRDIQVQVINCAVTAPIANTVSTTITGGTMVNGRIEACAGVPLSFCFDLKSTDTAAIIVASDNSAASTPGAVVTYSGQMTDSVRGCFSWTPNTLDTGLRIFAVTAKDSTCVSPGVSVAQTFVFPVYIWPITDIIKDTTICYGDSVSLLAVGGNAFTWGVLPGGASLSTLSCTTCRTPYAKPLITTQYTVQNNSIQYCSKNRDTVTVTVLDIRNDTLIANGTVNICQGDTLKLFSSTALSGYGYRWTGPNSFLSVLQNPQILAAQPIATGVYYLSSSKLGCYSRPDTVSVRVTPKASITNISSNTPVCEQSTLNLFANSPTGTSYTWSGPNSFSSGLQNPSITSVSLAAAGVYSVYTTLNGCNSNTVTTSVVINPKPVIGGVSFLGTTACGASNGSITLYGLGVNKNYTLNYHKNGVAQPATIRNSGTTGTIVISGLNSATYSKITISLLGCSSDTTNPIFIPDPNPPVVNSSNNSPVCQGDTFSIYATADSTSVTWLWTGPGGFTSTFPVVSIPNALPSQSGNYILTATKNNCVSAPDTTYVTVYPTPASPNAINNGPLCSGNTIVLQADSFLNGFYVWSGPNGFAATTRVAKISNGQPFHSGIYSVIATVNGCVSPVSTTTVLVNPTPAPVIGSYTVSNTTTCFGSDGSITLGGIDTSQYFIVTYKKNGAAQAPLTYLSTSAGFITIPSLTAATYSEIKITATTGCSSDPLPDIVVSDPPPPVISLVLKNNPTTCLGANGNIIVGGMTNGSLYIVSYSKNGVVQPGFSATADALGRIIIPSLGSGSYSITTTIRNCVSNILGPVVLTDPNPPVVTASNNTPICEGSTINLYGTSDSAGVTWSWTGPWGYTSVVQNPSITNSLPVHSGTYTLIAAKNNCYSLPSSTVVTVKPTPNSPVASNNGPVCEGDVLQLYVTTIPNTTFLWSGPGGFTSTSQSPVFYPSTFANAGTYTVVVNADGCLSAPVSTTAIVNAKPLAPKVTPSLITYCEGSVTLPLTAVGANLKWYDTALAGTPTLVAPQPSSGKPGVYYWYVSQTVNNCESPRAKIQVVIEAKSQLPTTADTIIYCQFANASPLYAAGTNIKWYNTASGVVYTTTPPVPSTTIAGVFNWYVTQTDFRGCESDRRKVTIIIHPALKTNIVASTLSICVGDTITVTDTANNNRNTTHTWDFDGAEVLSGNNSGAYTLKWQSAGGKRILLKLTDGYCSHQDSVLVTVHALPEATFDLQNYACVNEQVFVTTKLKDAQSLVFTTDGGVVVEKVKDKLYKIRWAFEGSKVVKLKAKSAYGCFSPELSDTISIYQNPVVEIEQVSRGTVCIGDTVSIKASYNDNYTYSWSGEGKFISNDNNTVMVSKWQGGLIYVSVNNIYGCSSVDSVYINTENCCDISLPDAFSPNGDGRNDIFRIISSGNQVIKSFIVVNRWGQKVFETTNQQKGWDGRLSGVPQDIGTYIYYIKYVCTDGRTIEKKGEVVLIK